MTDAPTYVGIDVAQDRLDVVLRPGGEYLEATNAKWRIGSVVRRLREENPALVVLKATGGMERPAAAALAVAGVPEGGFPPSPGPDRERIEPRM